MYYRGFREMTTKHVMEIAKKSGGNRTPIWPGTEATAEYTRLVAVDGNKRFGADLRLVNYQNVPYPGLSSDIILNYNNIRYQTSALMIFVNNVYGENILAGDRLPFTFGPAQMGGTVFRERFRETIAVNVNTAIGMLINAYKLYNGIDIDITRLYGDLVFETDLNDELKMPLKSVYMPIIGSIPNGSLVVANKRFADYNEDTNEYTLRLA